MSETLHIGTHEDLTVVRADAGAFEVEATYRPHGASPPWAAPPSACWVSPPR